MTEGYPNVVEPLPYGYYYDGLFRRQLHEFGALGFNFYDHVLKKMNYGPGDVALDIGAGMGDDGKDIAWHYRPRIVFLLEPLRGSLDEFDDRYVSIDSDLQGRRVSGVELLPSGALQTTVQELRNPDSNVLKPRITYIQPIPGVAEKIPLEDNSVSRLSMIHSIYEFQDVFEALREAARVMSEDGMGVVITNGPGDKLVFKDILYQTKLELDKEAPEGIQYTAPQTVSSRLDYIQAEELLSRFFEEVQLITYRDRMLITPDRVTQYGWSYNSYKRGFKPPIINQGRWDKVRQSVLYDRINREMAANDNIFQDTIDIGAIFFRGPREIKERSL